MGVSVPARISKDSLTDVLKELPATSAQETAEFAKRAQGAEAARMRGAGTR